MTRSLVTAAEIERLLHLVNTRHQLEGRARQPHDHLADPALASAFLRRTFGTASGRPRPADLRLMRDTRAAVWTLVGDRDLDGFERKVRRLLGGVRFSMDVDGNVQPEGTGWTRVATSVLPVLTALPTLRARLRVCAGRECGWILVDRSKNGSRRWCRLCRNRENVRAHRRRQHVNRRVRTRV